MSEPMVKCPHCGRRFPLTKALTGPIEDSLRSEYESEYKDRERVLKANYERQAQEKYEKVYKDRERALKADYERQAQEKAEKASEVKYHDRERMHQNELSKLRKQVADMGHQLEHFSQQAQGAGGECDLLETLVKACPGDEIRRVGTGRAGPDIIHRVVSARGECCGTIVWESKNTRGWSKSWISKLKVDQRREKAEVAVIVSSALPKDCHGHCTQASDVWIADSSAIEPLALSLRTQLIEVARYRTNDQGKSTKMSVLCNYLMSTEFKQKVEAIVEAFTAMRDDLDKERQVAERGWAKREQHLRVVTGSLAGMMYDIQARAPAFPRFRCLELPMAGSE